jgi:hypothetical protein
MPNPIKPPTPGQNRQLFRPYAVALGQLVYAWNNMHLNLSELFEVVVKAPSKRLGIAVWYSVDNDFLQRKMLFAAIDKATHLTNQQRDDLKWALKKIDASLRHSRNDSIHSPLAFLHDTDGGITIIPDFASDSPRARSLWSNTGPSQSLLKYVREQTKLAERLSSFFFKASRSIPAPSREPWPQKPELPHAHRKKNHKRSSRQNNAK